MKSVALEKYRVRGVTAVRVAQMYKDTHKCVLFSRDFEILRVLVWFSARHLGICGCLPNEEKRESSDRF